MTDEQLVIDEGCEVLYLYGLDGQKHVGRGIVAEKYISVLSGEKRIRVCDYHRECKDVDAGKWIYEKDVFEVR